MSEPKTEGYEIIIRNNDDKAKLDKMLEEGWKILDQGYAIFDNEPTRAFYQLVRRRP